MEYQANNPQVENPNNNNKPDTLLKKKNRTLQFYKFLFYSMKVEIKIKEFIDLVRFSNQSEIILWIISVVIFFNSGGNPHIFVWIHITHILRGIFGFVIMIKLPRTYQIVEKFKEIGQNDIQTKLFNDIVRDVMKKELVHKVDGMRGWLITYFVMTCINFVFDVIDFLYLLSQIDKQGPNGRPNAIALTLFAIAFLYLGKILYL
jgi:hypothetical protein